MVSIRHVAQGLGLAVVFAVIAACSSSKASPDEHVCTTGAYVFCRCEDRSEGTKLCRDGSSFDECKCDGSNPPPTDGYNPGDNNEGKGGSLEGVDAGPPPPPGAPQIDAACVGKLGIVAGASDDTYTYVMSYSGNGAFTAAKGHPGMRSAASVAAVGSSLVATYANPYSGIMWTKMTGTSWSAPFSVGNAMAKSPPSLTAFNGGARMFYLSTDDRYSMGTLSGSGWDDATATAEPAAGTATIPGKSAPSSAAISTSIVLLFSGNDGTLARETYSSSSWSTIGKFSNANAFAAQPVIVALDPGGAKDFLAVYLGSDLLLHVTTRDSAAHNWSATSVIDTAATVADTPSETDLVAMPGGKAMLLFRSSNNTGYYSIWDPATGFAAPQELVAGNNPKLASAPRGTRGHCGSDVTVAYAKEAGAVEIMRYGGGKWTGPFEVGGITKATYVGVGEIP